MPFSTDLDPTIIAGINEEYQKAASWLPFSAVEIKKIFNEQELEQLSGFLKEVKEAGASNNKKAQSIEKYSKVVLKLLKMAKVIAQYIF